MCRFGFFFFFSFYVLTLEIQLSRREGWGVIKRFNLATFFLCLFQSRIWISNVPCRSVSSIKIRRECVFLYWWKWWPSLFTLSLYSITVCICNEQIGGVMVSVIASRVVDCWFEPRSGHTKHYAIGICCFSAKHTTLSRKSKGCLLRNEDNVSAWGDMSTRGLLLQWVSNIKIKLSVLV